MDQFILPDRENIIIFKDNTIDKNRNTNIYLPSEMGHAVIDTRRIGFYGWAEYGFANVNPTRIKDDETSEGS